MASAKHRLVGRGAATRLIRDPSGSRGLLARGRIAYPASPTLAESGFRAGVKFSRISDVATRNPLQRIHATNVASAGRFDPETPLTNYLKTLVVGYHRQSQTKGCR